MMRSFESIMKHSENENINDKENNVENNIEKVDSMEKLPKPVYYIESPNDDTVLVGIDVTINHDRTAEQEISKIRWYDTSHERIMTASETRHKDDFFAFKRVDQEGGGVYYFTPMNLEIYNNKVKQRLAAGSDFTNNEDLIKAFLATTEDEV